MRLLCIALFLAATSCVSGPRLTFERLPAFSAAVAMRDPTSPPSRVIAVTDAAVPRGELIPFATFAGTTQLSLQGRLTRLVEETIEFMPDAYAYAEGNDQQVGFVSQHIGFGITTPSPVMATPYRVTLLREAPSILPFQLNDQGMVLAIQPQGGVQGLQEGDTVLSLNGVAIETDPARRLSSSWWNERLRIKPGDTIAIVAVRPGTGRVTGTVNALPNPRSYLTAPSMPEADKMVVRTEQRSGHNAWSIRSNGNAFPD